MNRHTRLALVVLASFLLTIAGGLSRTYAVFNCPGGTQPPRCFAATSSTCSVTTSTKCASDADCPVSETCSYKISGSASPGSGSITAITFLSQTNLSLSGTLPNFIVTQGNPASDGFGVIQAVDGGGACTVDVSFHKRLAGAPSNEDICFLQESYGVKAISGGSALSPAGTTTCSSVLAYCDDVAPAGEEFQQGSRILTIRSPIHSVSTTPDVLTELTRDGVFFPNLRLAFARAATTGGAFGPFGDIGGVVGGGPFAGGSKAPSAATIIRGTGQWSDVKVGTSFLSAGTPTLGEWGMIILSLLLLSASSVLLTRRVPVPAGSGSERSGPPLFDARLFRNLMAGTGALGALSAAAAVAWGWTPNATDLVGSLLCAGILAYLLHFWALLAKFNGKSGPS